MGAVRVSFRELESERVYLGLACLTRLIIIADLATRPPGLTEGTTKVTE